MVNPLKIEVTEAMLDLVDAEQKAWFERMVADCEKEDWEPESLWRCVLTAAFQNPEFRRQLLAQVLAAIPKLSPPDLRDSVEYHRRYEQYQRDVEWFRASLGRLLGEG